MVKLKYVIKIVAYIWSKPNIWSNFIWSNSNTWSNESYGHFACIWSNMQQIYDQNSRKSPYIIVTDMTCLLVNWTDVTSQNPRSRIKFAIARTNVHSRSLPYVVSFTDPLPLGRSLGTWSAPMWEGWCARLGTIGHTLYCMVLKQYGKHEWNY